VQLRRSELQEVDVFARGAEAEGAGGEACGGEEAGSRKEEKGSIGVAPSHPSLRSGWEPRVAAQSKSGSQFDDNLNYLESG
jgi:hypothetical protein